MGESGNNVVPIIIPAYEPDERLIALLDDLGKNNLKNIIIVNDGSGSEYDQVFSEVENRLKTMDGVILTHEVNKGKGRALKTAFEYVLDNYDNAVGVVTADSDGQHTVECIKNIIESLKEHSDSLILGVRKFDGEDIPWKSRFGNNLTLKVLKLVSGLAISDTQTGLRGIPRRFMKELLDVKGERFEFETRMLIESVNKYPIFEVPIETIYDSKENHQTHFNPLSDSAKIYWIFFEKFLKYLITSLSSFAIDILLFTVFCRLFKVTGSLTYILIATVLARVISSLYNYLMNYGFVFGSHKGRIQTVVKYYLLVIVQMLCSAGLVTFGCFIIGEVNETIVKLVVDTLLFLISYQVQKRLIF